MAHIRKACALSEVSSGCNGQSCATRNPDPDVLLRNDCETLAEMVQLGKLLL